MVLTLRPDIVKLTFEMTNASECHRDAVFVCGGDRFVVFDRSAETGVRLANVSSPFGRGWVRVRSLNRKMIPVSVLRQITPRPVEFRSIKHLLSRMAANRETERDQLTSAADAAVKEEKTG